MVRWGRGRTLDRSFTCRVSICKADAGLGIRGALENIVGCFPSPRKRGFAQHSENQDWKLEWSMLLVDVPAVKIGLTK